MPCPGPTNSSPALTGNKIPPWAKPVHTLGFMIQATKCDTVNCNFLKNNFPHLSMCTSLSANCNFLKNNFPHLSMCTSLVEVECHSPGSVWKESCSIPLHISRRITLETNCLWTLLIKTYLNLLTPHWGWKELWKTPNISIGWQPTNSFHPCMHALTSSNPKPSQAFKAQLHRNFRIMARRPFKKLERKGNVQWIHSMAPSDFSE